MRKMALIILALGLVLAGCGQSAPTADQPAPTGAATAAPEPTKAPAAPTQAPTEAPAATGAPAATTAPAPTIAPAPSPQPGGGASVRPPDALAAAAQQRLAQHLGVAATTLMLQSANAKEWNDSSLGCPQEGQVYLQVITPGFLLIFNDAAQSRTYEVHTAESEQQMVFCDKNQPTTLTEQASAASPAPADGAAPQAANQALLDQARQALAKELGVDAGQVTLQRMEAVDWRDSSLGCPQPDMSYLQVITPGYLIVLEAQGRSYEYHTDTGRRMVRCDAKP